MNALDEQRARLLGVMNKGRSFGKFILPLQRRSFGYWIGDQFYPYRQSPPLRRNIDYQSVGRPIFLVTTPIPGIED